MTYKFLEIRETESLKEIVESANRELRAIAEAMAQPPRYVPERIEPAKPREGTTAYSDGVAWDPGGGAGLYVFINGNWEKQEYGDFQPADPTLDDLAALGDPGADSGLFWDESNNSIDYWTPTLGLEFNGTNLRMAANQRTASLPFFISGGGGPILTGIKGTLPVPFACTIQSCVMLADQSGAIVIDIWKDTYSNYPPTNADSITGSANPTISGPSNKSLDTTLTGWTVNLAADDILHYNVDSVTSLTWCMISLKVLKT